MSSLIDFIDQNCLEDNCGGDLAVARAHRKSSSEPASLSSPSDWDPSLVIGLAAAAAVVLILLELALALLLWARKKKFARADPESGTNPGNTFLLPHVTEVTSQVSASGYLFLRNPQIYIYF